MASGFSLDEIEEALNSAGANAHVREAVKQILAEKRKPGRPSEPDEPLVIELAECVLAGYSRWAAAGIVTDDLPEPQRTTVRRRLYKKYNANPEFWLGRTKTAQEEKLRAARRSRIALQTRGETIP